MSGRRRLPLGLRVCLRLCLSSVRLLLGLYSPQLLQQFRRLSNLFGIARRDLLQVVLSQGNVISAVYQVIPCDVDTGLGELCNWFVYQISSETIALPLLGQLAIREKREKDGMSAWIRGKMEGGKKGHSTGRLAYLNYPPMVSGCFREFVKVIVQLGKLEMDGSLMGIRTD